MDLKQQQRDKDELEQIRKELCNSSSSDEEEGYISDENINNEYCKEIRKDKSLINEGQERFKFSQGSVALVGNPGGGKSTSIVEYLKKKENNVVLTFVFNKNAQLDLLKKLKENNIKQKVQTFDSFYLQFNKENDIRVKKLDNDSENNKNEKNEFHTLVRIKCLENIKKRDTNLNFIKNIKYLIIDEAQDMNEHNFNLVNIISKRLKNIPVITAGDPNQCIFSDLRDCDDKYMFSFCGNNIIELNINYRSSNEIINLATYFQNKYHKMIPVKNNGPLPKYIKSNKKLKIRKHILNEINKFKNLGNILLSNICIIVHTNKEGKKINKLLKDNKFITNNFTNNDNPKIKEDGINIMTYYKSKGLEFNTVFLVDFQDNYRVHIKLDNNLKYTGITRAIENLYLYYNTYDDEDFNREKRENKIMKNNVPKNLYENIIL